MTLPADIARCRGFGPTPEDWLEYLSSYLKAMGPKEV